MSASSGTVTLANTRLSLVNGTAFVDFSSAGTMLFDEASLKQVLTPSATGVTITSTPNGGTYNWASIESGFNYNDAGGIRMRFMQ